ncbi:Hypothetical predicted protein [Olea europaea subsp. europaea]|uniref:Uncharacterized protein n=1 Tax=Olea europaea subsp. europaea TaxID=158383 RepID=A0A8S0U005_OLEEU|nr:Hypothetical predicted protein [Olea europaea subsp. europaea]
MQSQRTLAVKGARHLQCRSQRRWRAAVTGGDLRRWRVTVTAAVACGRHAAWIAATATACVRLGWVCVYIGARHLQCRSQRRWRAAVTGGDLRRWRVTVTAAVACGRHAAWIAATATACVRLGWVCVYIGVVVCVAAMACVCVGGSCSGVRMRGTIRSDKSQQWLKPRSLLNSPDQVPGYNGISRQSGRLAFVHHQPVHFHLLYLLGYHPAVC